MRQILFLWVTLAAGSGCAWAQPVPPGGRAGPGAGTGPAPAAVDPGVQRRQIREVLQANRPVAGVIEPGNLTTVDAPPAAPFHLTPERKAEMREQLRRDREPTESRRGARP